MKKIITTCLIVLAASLFLCGCGQKCKNEEELLQDLSSHSEFYTVDESEISQFRIIKRLTEEENNKDTVYVEVLLEHEAASEVRAYTMYYTNYNDEWILDGIEPYEGEDAIWKVVPKSGPSNERIMEQLIDFSNEKISTYYSEHFYGKYMTDLYFFEEGKYLSTINEGQMISELEYSCLVETTRKFNYCEVTEEQVLWFVFDTATYEWYLVNGEITKLRGNSYYAGEWETVEKEQVLFNCTGQTYLPTQRDSFEGYCISGDKKFEISFKLDYPSSHSIPNGYESFGDMVWDPASYEMFISPDEILCYNYKYVSGKWSELIPVSLNGEPENLNQTGWVEADSELVPYEYTDLAYKALETLSLSDGIENVKEFWYPYENYSTLYEMADVLEQTETSIIPLAYIGGIVISEDYAEMEETIGTTIEECVICYYKIKTSYTDDADYWDIGVLLAKIDDKIQIINMEY